MDRVTWVCMSTAFVPMVGAQDNRQGTSLACPTARPIVWLVGPPIGASATPQFTYSYLLLYLYLYSSVPQL
jgi:hypothetical protein